MTMSKIDDGGPAFPEHHYFDPSRGQYGMHMTASDVGCGGMTLRDWFAGQALAGICGQYHAQGNTKATDAIAHAITLSEHAYHIADAMIAAREASQPQTGSPVA